MKFLLLLLGSGERCDYTIGCNQDYYVLEAINMEDAVSLAWAYFEDYGVSKDFTEYKYDEEIGSKIEKAVIVSMDNYREIEVAKEVANAWNEHKKKVTSSNEYKQFITAKRTYEKLKDKYEP